METTTEDWGYIGIVEKKMETTISKANGMQLPFVSWREPCKALCQVALTV